MTKQRITMFYVYILECADGTLYTGQTKHLNKRLKQHAHGRGAKYVKSRLPFDLRYTETYETRSEAMKREYQIKRFSRKKKFELFQTNASRLRITPEIELQQINM